MLGDHAQTPTVTTLLRTNLNRIAKLPDVGPKDSNPPPADDKLVKQFSEKLRELIVKGTVTITKGQRTFHVVEKKEKPKPVQVVEKKDKAKAAKPQGKAKKLDTKGSSAVTEKSPVRKAGSSGDKPEKMVRISAHSRLGRL